jgi:hypothetical protein
MRKVEGPPAGVGTGIYTREFRAGMKFNSPVPLPAQQLIIGPQIRQADMNKVKPGIGAPSKSPRACPPNNKYQSIAELFQQFETQLEGTCVLDPCGEENRFYAENFPHLVKLEFYNEKLGEWVDAKASLAVAQLRAGILDESKYRIGDSSRPRTLFWVPDIISNPDEIHDNIRNNGREIYSKRYSRRGKAAALKIVLVAKKGTTRAIITSFWCKERYHKTCIKLPAKHP